MRSIAPSLLALAPLVPLVALLASALAHAGSVPGVSPKSRGLAGALYRYVPNAGQEAAHAEAYRRHLAWHEANHDPLDWYAWRVVTGPRSGDFVDGTFGVPWDAFDARVKLAEDAADFGATAGPLARAVDHFFVELLPDSSRAGDGPPAPYLDVYTVDAVPGAGPALEAFLRSTHRSIPGERGWYRVVHGGASPSYLLVVPRPGSAELPEGERYWSRLSEARGAALGVLVRSIRSESWRFLPDLSLFPSSSPAPRP